MLSSVFLYCYKRFNTNVKSSAVNHSYSGHGVFSTKKFLKGTPLLEYVGKPISRQEAEERAEIPPFFSSYIMEVKPHNIWYLFYQ